MTINDYTITTGGTCLIDATCWYDNATNTLSPYRSEQKPSKPKGDQPMETLYNVIVVSKDREVLLDEKVVATDEGEAQLAIDLHSALKAVNLKAREVTILVREIGEVKVRKEVQKVKMVDKDEE